MNESVSPVCGKCNIELLLHPVNQCPYNYIPSMHDGAVIGYEMVRAEYLAGFQLTRRK